VVIAAPPACIEKVPVALHGLFYQLLDELRQLSQRMTDAERQIIALNPQNPAATHLQQICGIGPRTASALTARAVDTKYFNSGRQLSAWLGRTPREHSSGGSPSGHNQQTRRCLCPHGVWPGEDRLNVGLS